MAPCESPAPGPYLESCTAGPGTSPKRGDYVTQGTPSPPSFTCSSVCASLPLWALQSAPSEPKHSSLPDQAGLLRHRALRTHLCWASPTGAPLSALRSPSGRSGLSRRNLPALRPSRSVWAGSSWLAMACQSVACQVRSHGPGTDCQLIEPAVTVQTLGPISGSYSIAARHTSGAFYTTTWAFQGAP